MIDLDLAVKELTAGLTMFGESLASDASTFHELDSLLKARRLKLAEFYPKVATQFAAGNQSRGIALARVEASIKLLVASRDAGAPVGELLNKMARAAQGKIRARPGIYTDLLKHQPPDDLSAACFEAAGQIHKLSSALEQLKS